MRISRVEDLLVYQKALAAAIAVSALLKRPEFSKDFDLRNQLGNSSSRVPALIAEGFEQKSDRHFAHYLYLARGSAKESKTHLIVAHSRGYVSTSEAASLGGDCDEIGRMLTGLIDHLELEGRQNRWNRDATAPASDSFPHIDSCRPVFDPLPTRDDQLPTRCRLVDDYLTFPPPLTLDL
jgi:four helix bundle protein